MQKILVTGSEGFIGKNLCNFLRKRRFDISEYDKSVHGERFPTIAGCDAVIHLGANSSTTETDFKKILKQNFDFSVKLFEVCSAMDVKFQYASSASVYGFSKSFNEEDFCIPQSPYAFSKYMFDSWLLNNGGKYQGFRYFNVYGNGEEGKGNQASPVTKFLKQAKEEKEIKIFKGSDKYLRDFVCVDDICEIHHKMLLNEANGVFNVGTSNPVSFKEVAEEISLKIDCTIKEISMPKELINQYQKFTKADNKKLLSVIGAYEWKTVKEYIEQLKI